MTPGFFLGELFLEDFDMVVHFYLDVVNFVFGLLLLLFHCFHDVHFLICVLYCVSSFTCDDFLVNDLKSDLDLGDT